jgi:hypothetical protein
LTYQSTHENMRARMYSVLDITGQGFGSADACRVPWANETTTATQRNLEADATDRPAWGTPPGEPRQEGPPDGQRAQVVGWR